MTEKEKAEAYDKALERARAINNGKDVDVESGTTICEYIFPELKESEDEKIRKEIISILRNAYWTSNRNRFNELVAWLEKQKDKDKLIQELGEYKVKYTQEVLEKYINSMSNKDDERLRKNCIHFLELQKQHHAATFEIEECIDWLEKQCESDKNPNSKTIAEYLYKEKGYPISLNEEIPTFEVTMKDVRDYNAYKEKKLIEIACKWLREQKEMIGISFQEDFIERFKVEMNKYTN